MGFLRLYDHWDKESPNEALWILLPVERGVFSCELSVNAKFGMKESAPRVTCTVPDSCDPWRYFRQFQSKSIRLHPPHLHIRHLSADPNTGHFSLWWWEPHWCIDWFGSASGGHLLRCATCPLVIKHGTGESPISRLIAHRACWLPTARLDYQAMLSMINQVKILWPTVRCSKMKRWQFKWRSCLGSPWSYAPPMANPWYPAQQRRVFAGHEILTPSAPSKNRHSPASLIISNTQWLLACIPWLFV